MKSPFERKPAQPKPPRLHQMLGTKREDEQVQRVQHMIGAPQVTVIVTLDARDNYLDVQVMGGRGQGLPAPLVYEMLLRAQRLLLAREQQQTPPAPSQAPSLATPAQPAGTDDPAPAAVPPSGPPDAAVDPH